MPRRQDPIQQKEIFKCKSCTTIFLLDEPQITTLINKIYLFFFFFIVPYDNFIDITWKITKRKLNKRNQLEVNNLQILTVT